MPTTRRRLQSALGFAAVCCFGAVAVIGFGLVTGSLGNLFAWAAIGTALLVVKSQVR